MEVNSTTAASVSQLLSSQQQPASQPAAAKSAEPQLQAAQESAVVKLSAEAVKLNQSENQPETQASNSARAETQTNVNTERAEPRPQENTEPPGIQFVEDGNKNGRINTFA